MFCADGKLNVTVRAGDGVTESVAVAGIAVAADTVIAVTVLLIDDFSFFLSLC